VLSAFGLAPGLASAQTTPSKIAPLTLSDEQWKQRLTPAAYQVLRHEGTEYPGSSPLNKEHRKGVFACAGCDLPLFTSETKFESGTGWPSFNDPVPGATETTSDRSYGMVRTEVHCSRCGSHLGHVFEDGPRDAGGLRYCINSCALELAPGDNAASTPNPT
jgi:peptide-methionine (R)-S-oxide reductase